MSQVINKIIKLLALIISILKFNAINNSSDQLLFKWLSPSYRFHCYTYDW